MTLAAVAHYKPIFKQVWTLALPVMAANLLQSVVNVVDVFMAGRLGPIAIAAVGMSTTIRMLVLIMFLSVAAGAMALVAQARGAKDAPRISFLTRQALSLSVLMSLVLTVIGYLAANPLLRWLNGDGDPVAVVLGTEYLQILFLGTLFLILNLVVGRVMQGAGDTLTPLYLVGTINLLNIGFNYLFMFGVGPLPAFGVAGAAMGTVAARFLGCVIGIAIIYSGKNVIRLLPGTYRPNWRTFGDILSIGVPSGLQGVVRNSAQLLVIGIVTSTAAGTYGAAALAIGFQVESLAFMPGLGVNVAATSLVGQALGGWRVKRAWENGDVAVILGIMVMSVVALPIIIFAPQIIRLFDASGHPVVLAAGTSYLRINTFAQPLLAIAMVTNGAMRGAGDTRPGLIGTTFGRLVVVVPLAYLLALHLGMGVEGVWFALASGTTVQAIYIQLQWRKGRWLEVALRKSPLYQNHLRHLAHEIRWRFVDSIRTPIMARDDVREIVEDAGVSYHLPEGKVVVSFEHGDFQIDRGKKYIPRSVKSIPTAIAPAYD
ncbi:MAG: MATE family efflux transporter [Deinococcota bacterium]